jgi:sulfur relay (sulfurtransferase) DsrC/TusE family protein
MMEELKKRHDAEVDKANIAFQNAKLDTEEANAEHEKKIAMAIVEKDEKLGQWQANLAARLAKEKQYEMAAKELKVILIVEFLLNNC